MAHCGLCFFTFAQGIYVSLKSARFCHQVTIARLSTTFRQFHLHHEISISKNSFIEETKNALSFSFNNVRLRFSFYPLVSETFQHGIHFTIVANDLSFQVVSWPFGACHYAALYFGNPTIYEMEVLKLYKLFY